MELQAETQQPVETWGLDWDENMGISAPLYDIVDVVFGLQTRGFLRRQVRLAATNLLHDRGPLHGHDWRLSVSAPAAQPPCECHALGSLPWQP